MQWDTSAYPTDKPYTLVNPQTAQYATDYDGVWLWTLESITAESGPMQWTLEITHPEDGGV